MHLLALPDYLCIQLIFLKIMGEDQALSCHVMVMRCLLKITDYRFSSFLSLTRNTNFWFRLYNILMKSYASKIGNLHNLPFMYLVAEYMQISAPKAKGR